jgi:hypothetical protein
MDGCWFTLAKISHRSKLQVWSARVGKQSMKGRGWGGECTLEWQLTVVLWAKLGSFIDLELQQHNYRQVTCFWEWVPPAPVVTVVVVVVVVVVASTMRFHDSPYHENSQVHSILPNNHSWVHNCQASVEHRSIESSLSLSLSLSLSHTHTLTGEQPNHLSISPKFVLVLKSWDVLLVIQKQNICLSFWKFWFPYFTRTTLLVFFFWLL